MYHQSATKKLGWILLGAGNGFLTLKHTQEAFSNKLGEERKFLKTNSRTRGHDSNLFTNEGSNSTNIHGRGNDIFVYSRGRE